MHELERVLDEAANNKAAGEDEIPYEFLMWLGTKARQLILFIYNKVWSGKELPVNWRRAVIIALLKDGKDSKDTTSYRPISLLSCMSRFLEKIIANSPRVKMSHNKQSSWIQTKSVYNRSGTGNYKSFSGEGRR